MAVVSARGSPHSFPSSPLPASPQPDAERMFMRGGSGRSTGTSRTTSLREIDEEAAVVDDGSGKLYVAVGKDLKDGKSNLSAARSLRLLGDLKLILLHVHQPKSKLAAIVHQQAKPYCQIFFIYKESLACTREANLDSMNADSPRSTLSDGPELPARSVSLPPGHPGYMSSPDQQVPPRRSNSVNYPSSGLIAKNVERMSHIVQHSVHMTARNCSPNSSLPRNGRFSSSSLDGSPAPDSTVSSWRMERTHAAMRICDASRAEWIRAAAEVAGLLRGCFGSIAVVCLLAMRREADD